MNNYKIFTINPGSTSTKIALFEGEREIFSRNVSHDAKTLQIPTEPDALQLPHENPSSYH